MRQRAHAETLIEPHQTGREAETSGIGHGAEADAQREPRQERRPDALMQDLARSFHQDSEGNTGGTCRLTRATDQARFEVLDE